MADFRAGDTDHLPPTYQEAIEDARLAGDGVRDDGRIDVDLNSRLSRTLSHLVKAPPLQTENSPSSRTSRSPHDEFSVRLNIVIQVVGSRGDVQPFLALGSALQKHGHRVRLATHGKFRIFVRDAGLEFFAIGGNPEDLMAYMVKNPGLIPSMKSLRAGDIARKREMVAEMLDGCWRSCTEPDDATQTPFVADAIIANPPSFAHLHCAEALGIPVHMVFTMPWTSTTAFPHPLANVRGSYSDPRGANYMTYVLVEWMTWQGLADVINRWRRKLGLEDVPATEGPMLAETLRISHTYCWSPALIPKPTDWSTHIDVSGFLFREAPEYKPPLDLQLFLEAGPPPVYIGFGSIVLDDPSRFSSAIVEAVTACGERAIISPGWSQMTVPRDRPDIFCLEECPHEWLFQRVSMVIHHGGAGTTAIGLREARPTVIVPFFGDQPFWANMVAAAGAGPEALPQRQVTAQKLAAAIKLCQKGEVRDAAARLSTQIKQEDGVKAAVRSFHANLPLSKLRCDIMPDQPASWQLKVGGKRIKMSRSAAGVLTRDIGLNIKNLEIYRANPISIANRRWDPVSGMFSSLIGTSVGMVDGATGIFLKPHQELLRERSSSPSLKTRSEADLSGSEIRPPADEVSDEMISFDHVCGRRTGEASESATASIPRGEHGPQASTFAGSGKNDYSVAGSMARASGKSLGKFFTSFSKGTFVEMPLAVAEGFHSMPRLWGQEVRHHGDVTDWQSGGIKAGKTLVQGLGGGLRDVVMHPVEGARENGVLGAARGMATGTGSLFSNAASASLGLVAYPGQGIAKSLHSVVHSSTAKRVAEARHVDGRWRAGRLDEKERMAVVHAYQGLQRKDDTV